MKLSIFVVTYNQEKYIGECLDSILRQDIPCGYEVVVADDCSSDRTGEILDKYASEHPEFKVFHNEKNLGFVRNWKYALGKCAGEYVSILEGDDYWLTRDRVSRQIELLDANPEYGMCCAKARLWGETAQEFIGERGNAFCESYETLLVDKNDVMTSTVMIRRELFARAYSEIEKFLPEELQWDTSIWFWFAANSRIKFIDDCFEVYRILDDSCSRSSDPLKYLRYELVRPKTTLYFIQRYPVSADALSVVTEKLMKDVEVICENMKYLGAKSVWDSRTYKLGLKIKRFLGK